MSSYESTPYADVIPIDRHPRFKRVIERLPFVHDDTVVAPRRIESPERSPNEVSLTDRLAAVALRRIFR